MRLYVVSKSGMLLFEGNHFWAGCSLCIYRPECYNGVNEMGSDPGRGSRTRSRLIAADSVACVCCSRYQDLRHSPGYRMSNVCDTKVVPFGRLFSRRDFGSREHPRRRMSLSSMPLLTLNWKRRLQERGPFLVRYTDANSGRCSPEDAYNLRRN